MQVPGAELKPKNFNSGMHPMNASRVPARRLPSLDLLRGFESAARHLSITKAAEELHITQSAMSRQIKELEAQLGAALFERRHRAIGLSRAGRLLLPVATQVMGLVRKASDDVRELSGTRTLFVSTTPAFASLWLIPRLGSFARSHQGLDVRISADTRLLDLDREGIDVAIRYCPPELAGAGAVRMGGENVFPVCSPKLLRLRGRPLVEPMDLRRHTLLHVDDPDGRWPWMSWKTWLEVAGVPDLRSAAALRFSGYEQVIPAAIAGNGIALGRSPLVDALIKSGELVALFKRIAVTERGYWIVTSPDATSRSYVKDFVEWLRRSTRATNDKGEA